MLADGGGGGGTPTVTSNVTVDPGQIAQFAKFLDDMHEEVKAAHLRIKGTEDIKADSFGAYQASAGAHQKYLATLQAERENLGGLAKRLNEVVTGTNSVAKAYSDLDELNKANGAAIKSHLQANDPNA